MEDRLKAIARALWPDIETLAGTDYIGALFNVIGFLYTAPLALAGLAWLATVTDLGLMRSEWTKLVFLLALLFVSERLNFYFFVEVTPGTYSDWQASLTSVITWSAALVFGPSGLWLAAIHGLIHYARRWQRSPSVERRWSCVRNFAFNQSETLTSLVALTVYAQWAGRGTQHLAFPLPGLALDSILPAVLATFVWSLLSALVWVPILALFVRVWASTLSAGSKRAFLKFWAGALGWPVLVGPFAVLAAGLYAQNGVAGYLFFVSGLLLASLLAHHLSQAVERSQQRSRELGKLERLGRAILGAPPDASTLAQVLEEHVADMFPLSSIEIRIERSPLLPAQTLLHHVAQGALVPHDRLSVGPAIWESILTTREAHHFLPGEQLPWGDGPVSDAVLVAPILDVASAEAVGGIYLLRSWQPEAIANLVPAVQSLAAQVASALHRARVHAQTLHNQRVEQELALASHIQRSFLPDHLPNIPGWQLAATLQPARETSGDFYDVIRLPGGRWGLLIADVADKGVASALVMALSRTLVRTYAAQYEMQPQLVLQAANSRILEDTQADLFVTVFYGVLDPATGTLTYANAGHHPPFLLGTRNGGSLRSMPRTGMALGVLEDAAWEQKVVHIAPGEALLLYTDGVTDAQNGQQEFFGDERLLEVLRLNLGPLADQGPSTGPGSHAQRLQDALMAEIGGFVREAPQFDDITVLVALREL
ncbi:MAG: PP2C family protein-serine/threonine phosphatase [Anaerolineae bacterium]|jgi:serine phosphatase RsbU (regulator of sigma subunit)